MYNTSKQIIISDIADASCAVRQLPLMYNTLTVLVFITAVEMSLTLYHLTSEYVAEGE